MDKKTSDVGVSEVVGYVIIMGIILTSISIAYVNGYPALQDARDQERLKSVESAFSVMSDNIQEISVGDSTKRRTEMNLIGDTLGIDPQRKSWIHVSITNSTGAELCNRKCNVSIDPVVYESSAQGLTSPRNPGPSSAQIEVSEIVYENGAVIRDPGGNGSGMTSQPDWVVRDSGVIIKIIATQGGNAVTGEGTFSLVAEQQSSDSLVEVSDDGELDVTVTVGTESPTAWMLYMESIDGVDESDVEADYDSNQVTMEVNNTDKAVRSKAVVDAEAR